MPTSLVFADGIVCPKCNKPMLDVIASGGPSRRANQVLHRYVCRDLRCTGKLTEFEGSMTRAMHQPDRIIGGERFPADD